MFACLNALKIGKPSILENPKNSTTPSLLLEIAVDSVFEKVPTVVKADVEEVAIVANNLPPFNPPVTSEIPANASSALILEVASFKSEVSKFNLKICGLSSDAPNLVSSYWKSI